MDEEVEEPIVNEFETEMEEAPIVIEEPTTNETTEEIPTEPATIEAPINTVEVTTELPSNINIEPTVEVEPSFTGESDTELSLQINNLISEAKKRKAVESNDLHFLKFLNKAQVDSYYSLTNEEQELVKVHINERNYFNAKDVLILIQEALAVKAETLEEKIVRLMPETLKSTWNQMNESVKRSILSQAKLGYDLTTESSIEHFWYTRNFKKNETTKTLVNHDSLIQEDKLSDTQVQSILERIKSLK
jgi:uncharacterized ubiquitin-like protein YukD